MDLSADSLTRANWPASAVPAPGAERASAPSERPASRLGFEDLFADQYERMLRLAFLILGSREAAEDAVHDSFARVWERWDRIDNPGAYLRTVVVNRCRDALRRRQVRRLHLARHVEPVEPEREYLLDVLDRLPATRRAVVVLRFFEQLTIAEIGDVLRMREGTVKSTLHRSLDAIRREIPDE